MEKATLVIQMVITTKGLLREIFFQERATPMKKTEISMKVI